MLTPDQCREGRRLLGWSTERLGAMAGLTAEKIRLFGTDGKASLY